MIAPMEFAGVAAGSLVAAAWEGLVLAGVVAVCLRALPEITAAARSIVWTVVMLAVCGLPFVRFGGGSAAGSGGVLLDERFGLGLVGFWAALSVWRAAQLVRSAVWLRGVWKRALPVGVPAGLGGVLGVPHVRRDEAASNMGHPSGRAASLCVSDEVDRPCVVGFWRPRVLMPTALFEVISDGELAQIVMHEMEHLRRRDDWTNLAQELSLVMFPLNPALIWIERQLCVERELACDEQVLKATGARKAYAACLANLAEHSLVRRGVSLALGAWERQSELVWRVHRILSRNDREMGRRQVAGVVAVLMAGVLAGADGLAHAPALVSFGPGAVVVAPGERVDRVMGRAEVFPQGLKPTLLRTSYGGTEVPPFQDSGVSRLKVAKRRVVVKVSKPMVVAEGRATNMGHPSVEVEPIVVMVGWSSMMPVIVQDLQFTYAAVPTRNGWLFVQL